MNSKRLMQHILFWLCYFSISLFNELYISEEFSLNPTVSMFFQCVVTVLMLLLIKLAAVYYILYVIIPSAAEQSKRIKSIFKAFIIIVFATLICRTIIHFIVWPYLYHVPDPHFSTPRLAARFFNTLLDILQVSGAAVTIKLFKLRTHALNKEKLLIQEKLHSEIVHLKAQINPHFLFNSLNSIYSLTRSKSELAPEAVMQLSKILRYVLYESEKERTCVRDEIIILEDYISLQQMRFGKRINIKLEKNIDNLDALIIPLILLPLVENAFKHGTVAGNGKVVITINVTDNKLNFTTQNLFGGQVMKDVNPGIGLSNIKKQLELQYHSFLFEHKSIDDIFNVNLFIDLESYAADELFNYRR